MLPTYFHYHSNGNENKYKYCIITKINGCVQRTITAEAAYDCRLYS